MSLYFDKKAEEVDRKWEMRHAANGHRIEPGAPAARTQPLYMGHLLYVLIKNVYKKSGHSLDVKASETQLTLEKRKIFLRALASYQKKTLVFLKGTW